ncbi:hypothetical protein FOXG_22420 [Fusarium oxysporum f. sp. lycopersici 4287]|uniref:PD-(D/E)XK nuclease-like domain-containing protein n=1 Tax=Fusarium oxysporum f. sp. lycopersici (strain 4287 / CBS 123668 / FGSC 9935 / NRRL 34936) TaxID=426428 RepID=A0A0J9WV50_FUSO4|nr:hypothetical protein FOXG_19372 [Fusarium oxysporum f. sp. lycopersici 4287]XP_018244664.1 hypothetical protein FOXG_19736 [Fusarium oxysporum f. sp. lycopersici 4287]XP_018256962.1 uncharacterized protein FOXG_22420 [Fusarium oxysporum f. sp. lycopersici 4287]KNB04692.1 hypothetical protein FOXG_19372 [Fusarium oxysporum f. sp. lycopersici 4287]KNB06619.1 hypothetical protein FOXG_19736 [Fusarium oxysporum f. sp. lycopersici 4287]KNB18917.1 hypothetical protein FOXG_22420 [Fusarium oxyspor
MNDFNHSIISWLEGVPTDFSCTGAHLTPKEHPNSKKRPYFDSDRPLSPPPSQDHTQDIFPGTDLALEMQPSTPSNKRRKLGGVPILAAHAVDVNNDDNNDDEANEETPRQDGPRSVNDSNNSSRQSSHASNHSSPSKIFSSLSLNPDGLEEKQLDLLDPRIPDTLALLSNEMDDIGTGDRVIPEYLESEISDLQKSTPAYGSFKPRVFDKPTGEGLPLKRYLPHLHHELRLAEVMQLVGDAKDCNDMEDDEAGWNNLVHTPLLKAAFYGKTPRGRQLDGFRPCTSAGILPAYRMKASQGKKVDYVFHLDPEKDDNQPQTMEAIKEIRGVLTDSSINHTSYAPLRPLPISVSIETKRGGASARKAQLQMGVWHAAQWRHLYKLAGDDLQKLPFIPGILVHGHEWIFVASTYHNGKTTLWTSGSFGSTLRLLSTFQVIAGIQRLRTWALEVFWPWYVTLMDAFASYASHSYH